MAAALIMSQESFSVALGVVASEYERLLMRCGAVEAELRALQAASAVPAEGSQTAGNVAASPRPAVAGIPPSCLSGKVAVGAGKVTPPAGFVAAADADDSQAEPSNHTDGALQASRPSVTECAEAGRGPAEAAADQPHLRRQKTAESLSSKARETEGHISENSQRTSLDAELVQIREILDSDEKFKNRRQAGNRIWLFLTDPESSIKARCYKECMNPLFVASLCLTMTPHIPGLALKGFAAGALEIAVEAFFATDILVRFLAAPSKRAFCRNVYNIIDLLSALPLALRLAGRQNVYTAEGDVTVYSLVLVGFVPVLRLLKLLRRFEKFHLVFAAFKVAFEALPVLLYTFCVIWCAFSSLLFVFEPLSFFEALWLTVVTMTTVGYGDTTPETPVGHLVLTALMLCSALYMAIPLGIVGNAFNRVWEERHHLLLMRRTRVKLAQWGYSPIDIPRLFVIFARRTPGELTYSEFRRMFLELHMGMKEVDIYELFQSFDEDGGGSVDHEEFLKGLYPREFFEASARRGSASEELVWLEEAQAEDGLMRLVPDASEGAMEIFI